jgi:hypothetical protein
MTTHVTTVMDAISALTPMLIAGLLALSARWSLRRIR